MKKTILYIIDTLSAIGGAEIMMIAPLKDLREHYRIIVVTLRPGNAFDQDVYVGDAFHCLEMNSRRDVFGAGSQLREIIRYNQVDLVHSFLYWSSVVARIACGKSTAHVFSLATLMGDHVYRHKWYSRYTQAIDYLTYKKNHVVISPTREVLEDFDRNLGIRGKSKVIYNFVLDAFFENQVCYQRKSGELKLVAVGNIKKVKNYQVMIDAMKLLKDLPISLDVYGSGSLTESQQKKIKDNHLPVRTMGPARNIHEILPHYDGFLMASFQEGFGISAAEAMTIGLPLVLSDIKVFREVTDQNALFFDPHDPGSLAAILNSLQQGGIDPVPLSEKGKLISSQRYTRQKYITELIDLYKGIILY